MYRTSQVTRFFIMLQEAAARENDAMMLRKLPAGSRAFVERQRRARALHNGDEHALRLLGGGADGQINYKITAKGAAAPHRINGAGNAGAKAVARARMGAQREGMIEREAKIQVCGGVGARAFRSSLLRIVPCPVTQIEALLTCVCMAASGDSEPSRAREQVPRAR